MPKKALPPQAVVPLAALHPPIPPSPIVEALRKDWRWAGISQFVWTFSDAFGLLDWDIEQLEADFDGEETRLIPTLIAKLLFALTYNRQINRDNAFENLRKQYIKRRPEQNPLGTEEETKEWATLGLGQKVQILWDLCEWQLEDPARFRGLLKSEEEAASWRVDPIGWDKAGNTYFLFDDNRLWVQRVPPPPPRPPKKTSQKAKRALKRSRPSTTSASATASTSTAKKSHRKREKTPLPTPPPRQPEELILSGSRRRNQVQFYGNPTPTGEALKRGAVTPASANGISNAGGSGSRPTRSSARNLEAAQASETPSKLSKSAATPLPLGTRVSRRLRNVDDDWQQIPEEWLSPVKQVNGKGKGRAKRKDDDEESELSELTDEDEHEARVRASGVRESPIKNEPSQPPSDELVKSDEITNHVVQEEESEHNLARHDSIDEKPANPDTQETGHRSPLADTELADDKPPVNGLVEQDGDVVMEESKEEISAEVEAEPTVATEISEDGEGEGEAEENDVKAAVKEADNIPEGFVEWEAVCVTLYDWRTWPEQFANSRDPDEKALYSTLTEEVGPTIIDALVIKEQERLKQEAINNRKRSSRIATRELEREEQLRHEQAQREMEERMERTRMEEQRKAKEQVELLAREKAREDRLREREERLAAREEAIARKAEEEARIKEKAERDREKRKRRREGEEVSDDSEPEAEIGTGRNTGSAGRGSRAISPSAAGSAGASERWELNCEVCKKTGWNIDGDQDVVCCDDCGRWQHVECHDRLDESEGRRKRNWDQVDFKCKECRRRAARQRQRHENGSSPVVPPPHSQTHGHLAQNPPHRDSTIYPLIPGSKNGPSPPYDPSRPPPPPLKEGQFYSSLPSRPNEHPAGFAVYYSPGSAAASLSPMRDRAYIPASPQSHAQILSTGYGTMPNPAVPSSPGLRQYQAEQNFASRGTIPQQHAQYPSQPRGGPPIGQYPSQPFPVQQPSAHAQPQTQYLAYPPQQTMPYPHHQSATPQSVSAFGSSPSRGPHQGVSSHPHAGIQSGPSAQQQSPPHPPPGSAATSTSASATSPFAGAARPVAPQLPANGHSSQASPAVVTPSQTEPRAQPQPNVRSPVKVTDFGTIANSQPTAAPTSEANHVQTLPDHPPLRAVKDLLSSDG